MQVQAPGMWVGQITQGLRERNGGQVVAYLDPMINIKGKDKIDEQSVNADMG